MGTSLVLLLSSISLPNSVAIAAEQETVRLEEQQSEISSNGGEMTENSLQKSIALYRQQQLHPTNLLVQEPKTPLEETSPESPEAENQVLVAEIVIDGTDNLLLLDAIYRAISTQPGRPTTRSLLQEEVNEIFATGYFADVTVVPEDTPLGIRITFVVEPNPTISRVEIQTVPEREGDRIFSQGEIDKIFSEEYGQILNLRTFQARILELNEKYQEQGYDLAQVVGAPEVSEDGTVTLVVAEGQIEDIRVRFFDDQEESVEGYTSDLALQQIELQPGDVFNRKIAQKDLERVFAVGLFNDVRFSFAPGEDPSKVIINVDIIEIDTILDIGHKLIDTNSKKALSLYQQALQDYQLKGDTVGQALALTGIADAYRELKNSEQALNFYHQALRLWRVNRERLDESKFDSKEYTENVIFGTGFSSSSGIFGTSHGFVSFRWHELVTLINLSNFSRQLGDYQQALYYLDEAKLISQNHEDSLLQDFERVSELFDSPANDRGRALFKSFFLSGNWVKGILDYETGLLYSDVGQKEKGINYQKRGLLGLTNGFDSFCEAIRKSENNESETEILFDYFCDEFVLDIFQNAEEKEKTFPDLLIRYFEFMSSLSNDLNTEKNKFRLLEAFSLQSSGDSSKDSGNWRQALEYYSQAQRIYQDLQNNPPQAATLNSMAEVSLALNDSKRALEYLKQALEIWQTLEEERPSKSDTLILLAQIHSKLAQYQPALDFLEQAKIISQQFGYLSQEAKALFEQAKIEQIRENFLQAKVLIEKGLILLESQQLAVSFQENFDPLSSALFDFVFEERDRESPTLSELQKQSISLAGRNQSNYQSYTNLVKYFDSKQEYYEFYIELLMQLHQQNPAKGYNILALEASELNRSQSFLTFLGRANRNDRDNASSQNRYTSNSFEFNNRPRLSDIQEQILDEDTVLLEYAFGEERSYLWLVTKTNIQSYELPNQETIEVTAQEFYEYLTVPSLRVRENKTAVAGLKLSQMILPPAVAGQLGNKRLLIVGDGILQYIPFSAIPIPQPNGIPDGVKPAEIAQPLLTNHEIVALPSASTLAALRRKTRNRPSPTQQLAVFADPVFGRGDSQQLYAPLPKTREQARQIINALPPEFEARTFFGHDASRQKAIAPEMSQYQILHFASHGILDRERPERSGMVLSAINQEGELQRGLLSTPDTFNLNLSADLVVLSGCRTGLGKEYRGEGIVGLTGGLMYGGAKRVVVSLWSVEEEATTELMKRFYQEMFANKLPPTAALRAAQLSMWEDSQWKTPYNWAAFAIQGEWNDLERPNH